MELFIISGYVAICIAIFTVLRIPLNRWTVPTASIGGLVLVFAFIQVLNFYHPYSSMSRQASASTSHGVDAQTMRAPMAANQHNLVAWFHQNNLLRFNDGSEVEVTFDSIPGKVFSGKLGTVLPMPVDNRGQDHSFDPSTMASRIPVLINITDARYSGYASQLPNGSRASTAIYGQQLQELALVRKTLLRMSAWMNYLTPVS
ncbi:MAG: hypothetical protein OEU50_14575 [Gammaproteobacteria bacterium]|nr:hypothetical protein [Gammaproteobacteria bacterium]